MAETKARRRTGGLLERDLELAAVRDQLTTARRGRGTLLLISGPAGVGKTSLLGRAVASARQRRFVVLRARGGELERDAGFGVVRQLFEPCLHELPADDRRAVLGGAAELAAPALELPGRAGGESPHALLHGLYWLTANLAERSPLLICVDDAHWADAPSLRFLAYLLRRAEALPVAIAVAARTGEPGAEAGALPELASDPLATTIEPRPLTLAGARMLLQAELGDDAADEFCDACHIATAGNPLLLGQLAAATVSDGIAPTSASAARVRELGPRAVAAALLARLAHLPESATALAAAVAVLETAELQHAAALAGMSLGEAGEAAELLVDADVLNPSEPLAFVHPLVRASLYADLPEVRRSLAHRDAASVLRAAGASSDVVAKHLLRSEPASDALVVAELVSAAERELARPAPEAGAAFLRRALREPPAPDARPRMLLMLGSAEAAMGEPAGVEHLGEALALAQAAGERAEAALALSRALLAAGRPGEAIEVLDDVAAGLHDDLELVLRLTAESIGMEMQTPGRASRAMTRLAALPVISDPPSHAERLLLASRSAVDCGNARPASESAAVALRALGRGELLDVEGPEAPPFLHCVATLIFSGRFDAVDRVLEDALERARSSGSSLAFVRMSYVRSHLAWRRGDLASAESEARSALDTAGAEGWVIDLPWAMKTLLDALRDRGEPEAAQAALEEFGMADGEPQMWLLFDILCGLARAKLRIARGEREEGIADLLACGERLTGWGIVNPAYDAWRSSAALALLESGEPERARRLAAEELALADLDGGERTRGIALRACGLVEGGERGLQLLEQAVSVLAESAAVFDYATALADLGAALRRAGRRSDARPHLTLALDLARRCGAAPLAERAHTELLAAGSRPRRLMLTGRDSLTPSERRVCEMADAGMTNREIAQGLFVTLKTVEMHLGRSYRKLGIRSRDELAGALESEDDPS